MSNVNQLKQYMTKKGEYDRLQARLKVINIELENWDKVKAATITDMPTYRDDSENNSIVERSATSREEKELERDRIEYELAKLSEILITVDSKLDMLGYEHRWILDKKYRCGYFYNYTENRQNKNFYALLKLYNKEIGIVEGKALGVAIREAEKAYENLD